MNLSQRYQSKIESPVSTYGRSVSSNLTTRYALYDGLPITAFLYKNNTEHFGIRSFLRSNKIGNPFTDLVPGQLVQLEIEGRFTKHPDFG
jgi:hypothetical protein